MPSMSSPVTPPDEPNGAPPGVEAVYREHVGFLINLARRSYGVSPEIAESLVHDAFASFANAKEPIRNVRSWLVSAVFNGCRYHWRRQARETPLPADAETWPDERSHDLADKIVTRLAVRAALARLDTRCRHIVHLRFHEYQSAREMAEELATTKKYAEKLLYGCVERVRQIYLEITKV